MSVIILPPKCVVCKIGDVIPRVEIINIEDPNPIIGGDPVFPGANITFYCSNPACSLLYHLPPGWPHAREDIQAARRKEFEDTLRDHFSHW